MKIYKILKVLYKLAHGIYSQFHAIFGCRFAYWENYANFVG